MAAGESFIEKALSLSEIAKTAAWLAFGAAVVTSLPVAAGAIGGYEVKKKVDEIKNS